MTSQETPTALARLVRGRTAFAWVVSCCPFCGKEHQHGGGTVREGDPRAYLATRVADCHPARGEVYMLAEVSGGGR